MCGLRDGPERQACRQHCRGKPEQGLRYARVKQPPAQAWIAVAHRVSPPRGNERTVGASTTTGTAAATLPGSLGQSFFNRIPQIGSDAGAGCAWCDGLGNPLSRFGSVRERVFRKLSWGFCKRRHPPASMEAPSTRRTFPTIDPAIEAFTTSWRPARRAASAMISSAALPKVALRSHPAARFRTGISGRLRASLDYTVSRVDEDA